MIGQVACAASPVLIFVRGTEIKPGAGGGSIQFLQIVILFLRICEALDRDQRRRVYKAFRPREGREKGRSRWAVCAIG